MENFEKITRHDALIEIRQRICSCFDSKGLFAFHENDRTRAIEIRQFAAENNISLLEMKEISLGYIYKNGYQQDIIATQYEKLSNFFAEKLN